MNLRNCSGPYSIGLDMGTGSVGWAVTDGRGKLLHFKKQPTWGSRLFDSAQPASEARVHRGQRRRYVRRRWRLDLLQALFVDEMAQVDPGFSIASIIHTPLKAIQSSPKTSPKRTITIISQPSIIFAPISWKLMSKPIFV